MFNVYEMKRGLGVGNDGSIINFLDHGSASRLLTGLFATSFTIIRSPYNTQHTHIRGYIRGTAAEFQY